jgi:hypothetical protein
VVYKIDRLTRSLTDFSRLIEVFERNKVSFVAVTQQFNTTTSMGRLMLNVLLSFAQFEREVMVPSAEPPPGGHTPPRWQRTQVHVGVHRSYSRRSAAQLPIPVDATSCSSRWSISSTLIGFSDALPKPATWHSPSISP